MLRSHPFSAKLLRDPFSAKLLLYRARCPLLGSLCAYVALVGACCSGKLHRASACVRACDSELLRRATAPGVRARCRCGARGAVSYCTLRRVYAVLACGGSLLVRVIRMGRQYCASAVGRCCWVPSLGCYVISRHRNAYIAFCDFYPACCFNSITYMGDYIPLYPGGGGHSAQRIF